MSKQWELDRPVDCQYCRGQGHSANTPKIVLDDHQPQTGAPRGSVACRWCGYEISAPSLPEAIHKWRCFQEVIRLGYSVLNDKAEAETPEEGEKIVRWYGYLAYLKTWSRPRKDAIYYGESPLPFDDWLRSEGVTKDV